MNPKVLQRGEVLQKPRTVSEMFPRMLKEKIWLFRD